MKRTAHVLCAFLTLLTATHVERAVAAQLVVLSPVTVGNRIVMRAGPKGEAQAPILKRASNNLLTQSLLREASRSTTKFMLELDEQTQRLAATPLAPTYLLLADENRLSARRGFWLAESSNNFVWHADPFAEMAVDKKTIDDGDFEELFAYAMGHLLLHRVLPNLPNGISRTPHSSLAITDYPTAFEEGFAIHFQGLALRLTQNATLKARDAGLEVTPFMSYWQSNLDRTLRIRGMRANLFVQQQLPSALQIGDASGAFDLTHFRNGQQMLSSEGVIATLFYHLMVVPADTAAMRAKRYQLLFSVLHDFRKQRISSSTPLFIHLVQAHIQRAPQSRTRWLNTVLSLTYGATASTKLIRETTQLSALGQEGRAEEFATALQRSRAMLATLTAQVTQDPKSLGAAIGPEFWLAIKYEDKDKDKEDAVLTVNLNTVEKTGLMNVLGFEATDADLLLADRATHGPFLSVDDFIARRDMSPTIRQRLLDAHKLANSIGGYLRP